MAQQKNPCLGFLFQNANRREIPVKMLLHIREQGRIVAFFNSGIVEPHIEPRFASVALIWCIAFVHAMRL